MMNYELQCIDTEEPLPRLSPSSSQSFEPHAAAPEYEALIVDDNPDIAPLVDRALRPFHIKSEAVAGGTEAIMRLRGRSYDLVVLDLAMGDVHGLEVLRTLRELPLNRDVPVLVLTANGSSEALARSFGHGADEFVEKPFDLRELGLRAYRLIRPFRQ